MEIKIREARRSDIHALKDKLREADREEILASGYESPEAALTRGFEASTVCLCVDIEGSPSALFGVVPESLLGDTASVWFLGAPELARMKKSFVKLSRAMIKEFLSKYPNLWNIVDSRYASSIRWLKSCGAVFQHEPVMLSGVPFYGFVIRRNA